MSAAYSSLAGFDLASLALEADGFLRRHLRRKILAQETGQETIRLRVPRDRIILDEWPVTAVSSVTISGTVATGYEIENENTLVRLNAIEWPSDLKIVVSYTAGYASGTVDHAVLRRAALQVAFGLARASADPSHPTFGLGEVKRIKLGDYEVEAASGISQAGTAYTLPDSIERLLVPYKRQVRIS